MLPRALRSLLLCSLFVNVAFARDELVWPEITAETKPWSRWWWLGNIGTKQDFTVQMERYAKAGLGGLEITPIYGVRGQEDKFRSYLSPEWMSLLDHVLDEGKRLGLGIDMSTGTGWPFGGPWVTPDSAARRVMLRTFAVKGGSRLDEPVKATDDALVRVAGPRRVAIGELKDPVATNANLQDLALDQVRFARALPLSALVAHSEAGQKITLTEKVSPEGRLDWTAPAGNWTLYAVFSGWHGKQVERAGPGGEGDVIDHFSSDALAKYLAKFDAAYAGHQAGRLRGYFNDSYEVDDASGEANWTPKFFEEFKRRRGYELRDELPAFFGKDTAEKNARVMADHRETVSDLLLDEFTKPWATWAKKHGGLIRNQAHGSPANIIDLYAASDIPETEGENIAGMKLASSAAHLTGKQLTSAETATWLDEHWVSTLGDIKARVDRMFLGGVNHNCYHGTVFSPPGEPWPGHHFYASVELDPTNSIWADFDVLNAYVTRCQSFLQAGKPANDILLYYPIHEVWAERGDGVMPHFGSNGRVGIPPVAPLLLNRGYTFDFVSDRLLASVSTTQGALIAGGARYRVILVPETKTMPLETMQRIFALAEQGATVVFHRSVPDDVPGLGGWAAKQKALRELTKALREANREADGVGTLARGRGRLLVGPDLEKLLTLADVGRETLVDQGVQFVRRTHENGLVYFLLNTGKDTVDGTVKFGGEFKGAAIFDPLTGRTGVAPTDGVGGVHLALGPGESCIVKTFRAGTPTGMRFVPTAVGRGPTTDLKGTWSVVFTDGGPTLPAADKMIGLVSWTELPGEAVKAFAGTAVYRLEFECPPTVAGVDAVLDLGLVADSARVRLNGRECGALIAAPWRVLLAGERAPVAGRNVLEVTVTNLAANRIADLDRRDPSWKKFYNTNYPARIRPNRGEDGNFSAAKWSPRNSGLLGPVSLTPLARTAK